MRVRLLILTLIVLALAAYSVTGALAGSEKSRVKASLDGFEETPAVSSTGHGTFQVRINDDASLITYSLTFGDLEATTLFAHIHFGQRGVAGGVSAFLCGGGGKPACPASGTVTGTITPADVIGPAVQGIAPGEFGELVRAIRAGITYANVHTNKHPGGEIRGQINDPNQRD